MIMWTQKILDALLRVFKKENLTAILIAAIAILIFLLAQTCNSKKQLKNELATEKKINEQNIKALTDTLHYVADKIGNIEADKAAFITSIDNLKELNSSLYKIIENVKGDVISVINSKVKGVIPPMEADNKLIKYDDGVTYGLGFVTEFSEDGLYNKIIGVSDFKAYDNKVFAGKTRIDSNVVQIGLAYGFKENDDTYEVFAKSPSKHVIINELDGALILDKKKGSIICPEPVVKRWGVGPNFNVGYGFTSGKFEPVIGFGVQYNMFRF